VLRKYSLSFTLLLLLAVTAGAQTAPPVLAPIGSQSVDENVNLNFGVSATDADATTPTLSTSTLPSGANFTPNGDGTGTFDWTPTFADAGVYSVTFYATDAVTADVDSEIVSITVTDVPRVTGVTLTSTSGLDSTSDDLTAAFTLDGTAAATAWYRDGAPDMALYVPMEGGATSAAQDYSGNAVPLTVTGNPVWSATGGHDGAGAWAFDGSDYILAGNIFPTLGSYTKSVWVYRTGTGSNNIMSGSVSPGGHVLYASTSSQQNHVAAGHNGSFALVRDPDSLDLNTWYHITLTYDYPSGLMILYKDGVEVSRATLTGENKDVTDAACQIGSFASSSAWTGSLDDARLYDYALSPDQVAALYAGGSVTKAAETSPGESWRADVTPFNATSAGATVGSNTITLGNAAPILTAIGAKSIDENANLNFVVTASDPDGTTLTLSAVNLPTGATFTAGTFDWTPTYSQAGPYDVTFIASDGYLADSEVVTITVNNVNQAPVLDPIGAKSIDENANLNFVVTASDPDGTTPTLSAVNLPTGANFTAGTFDWTPTYAQAGPYSVTFIADDGALADSEVVTITVNDVPQAPVVSDIPDQTVPEGSTFATINLDDYVTDADNADADIVWTYSGNSALSVVISLNRVATIVIPSVDWNGAETITFKASDPGGLADSNAATFTVTPVNDAPVVSDIPDQTVAEGATFTTIPLDNYLADVDNVDSEITWTYSGNTELTVSIDAAHVATITIPNIEWSGAETITFTATDPGDLADSDPATFTVTAVNDAPVVSDIPNQTVPEGSTFTTIDLNTYVTDVDNLDSEISWTYSGNTALTVSIDASNIATVTIPDINWNGSETITFTATDPGSLSDFDPATFTVTPVNDAPVVSDIPDQTIAEGATFATINLDNYVSDVDNLASEITWTYAGNTQLTVSIVNRVASITAPNADWFGAETITFTATDPGSLADSDPATFTITAVNDAPVVSDIPDQTVPEGSTFATIDLNSYVNDVDNLDSEIGWTYSGNTELTVSIDASNIATITIPDINWNGAETITFTATDPGMLADANAATFTVTPVNDAPVVSDIPDQTIVEGDVFATIDLDSYVTDIDNTPAEMNWTVSGNTELSVNIDAGHIATITMPNADWNGSETITFTATDPGALFDSDPATFTATAVNDAPVVSDIPDQTIAEGATFATIDLNAFVADVDNLDSEIGWTYAGNTELTVSIDPSNIATITIPDINWNGAETITFTATDPGALTDSDPATFTVTAVNDAPVVAGISDQTISEGSSFTAINLNDYVSDVDNLVSEMTWSYSGNSQLSVSIVNNVAIVTVPNQDWNGAETITFTATDPGGATGSDPVVFTVTGVNDAPVLSNIPDQTIAEGASFAAINLDDYVTDIDNADSEIDWTYTGNSQLTVSIDANRVATVTPPSPTWNGSETITFTATDPGLLNASDFVTFTVSSVNDAPVVADIPDQTIAEGDSFLTIALDDYVTDIDNADSEITWTYSGNTDLTVSIDVNRIATITPPDADWNGSELITFTASDPATSSNSDAATFTITPVNDAPVVADIPDQSVVEGSNFATVNLDGYVSDIDNLASEMTWTYAGNTDLTVSIDVNRIATITIPNADWNGSETITFTASDPGSASDSDPATFTVTGVNDAPVVSDIPNSTVAEGSPFPTINLDTYVTDIDNLDSEIDWTYSGNTELTVSIDANRIATITPPTPDWNGSETITFTASDPGLLSDSDPATFTMTPVNDAPVVSGIPDQTVDEGSSFTTINLDNYVTDVDNAASEMTWGYSGNVELSVSIVNRLAIITIPGSNWNGSEQITFTATDPGSLSGSQAATFTVNSINDAPVVSDIPNQTVTEGTPFATITLDSYVTDIDHLPSQMTWSYSGNVQLSVSIDANRIATITAPSADWNGSESITFTATDPGGLFDSDPATFTVTPVNDAPVVADIPDQTIDEGATFTTIALDDYVSDVDNADSEISWSYTGSSALTVSISASRVATISTPGPEWSGVETITFTATDPGLLTDSDPATFTVNAVNDAPVVSGIPDQTIAEGASFVTIPLDDYVTDIDNLSSEMSWSYTGNTELSVSIDASRIATITAPDPNWNGAEAITFTATDPGGATGSDPATFTVTPVNDAPVMSDIPNQTIAEGGTFTTITLDNYVSDVDNADNEITWSYSGNTQLTVSIDVNRVVTISTPSPTWNGSETITFTASDPGLLTDSDPATFTVSSVNDAPVVSDIPDQTVSEGAAFTTINLDNYVTDIDNADSEITWTWSGNTDLIVSIDANRIATITTPNPDWNGSELITFTATDPAQSANSDAATFTVTPQNDAPVVADIPNQTVAEGANFTTINLDSYVTDVDNLKSDLTWSYSGNTNLSVSIVNRVAIISTPSPDWNGAETITFTATDPGGLSDFDPATFTVTAVNDAPVVTDIPNQTIAEGATFVTINLDNYVSDADNLDQELEWTYVGNSALTVSLNVNRVATITVPSADWNGSETITCTATDPLGAFDSDPATFTVTAVNDAPVVADIPDQTVPEGGTFTTIALDNFVSDVDNTDAEMNWTYSGNTELSVSIDASRVATITIPSASWNGAETITFTATDPGSLSDADAATFTVTAVNSAPVVTDIPNQTVAEGATFATIPLDNYVSDLDNADSEISWSYSGNTQLTVSIDVNRIATITIPNANWNGSEIITFTASDPGLLADSDPATFTVTSVNDAPVMSDIPNQTIPEGSSFATIPLDNYVSDVDNADNELTWTYSGNTQLTVSIDVNRVVTVTPPSPTWNGSETITFTATDPGSLNASDAATFTVSSVDDAPVVTNIPDQTVAEGSSFTTVALDDYVIDVDNADSEMVWTYSGNTDLTVSIDANRIATVTIPSPEWNGTELITFTATDPSALSNSDQAAFTVTAINDAPVVLDIPDQTVTEGTAFATVNLDNYVTDPDNLPSEITWSFAGNVELSVSIVNRVAIITAPFADWNGFETITFTATDPGGLSSFDPALFRVTAVNDAPVVSNIPDQTVAEGATFVTIPLDSFVTDVDNLVSEMNWSWVGNSALTVSLDVNRVATISIPNADWNGVETITFRATDPGGLTDSDPATFTVTAVNDAPVVSDIPDQTIVEGSTFVAINLDNYVADIDNTDDQISWTYGGNTDLTVNIDANRIATVTIPNANWNGAETITFTATDPGFLTDSDPVTFSVTPANDAPVVSDIPDQTVAEGATFTTITLDNYVADIDNVPSEMTWTSSGNTELSVSIDASRIATITIPNADWNGSETITFTATDPGLLSDSDPATFTVTAVNDAPVISDIPDQTIDEGTSFATINLDAYVTDIDNADAELTWGYSGNTELTVSIDPSHVATITAPSSTWNGAETITFTVTDPGLLNASDLATFTVTPVNNAPVVSGIPDQTIAEGATFVTIPLDNFVTDVDNLASEMSWSYSGNTELGVSIDLARVATITIPNADWNGSEAITFTATDPGGLSGSDAATFTVTPVNDAPVVSDIPNQTIAEGASFATISLDNYVTDVDNADNEIAWSYTGNTELTVNIDVNRVVTITPPTANWNGSETITFTASDPSLLTDSDPATFTVTAVNNAPVVSDIPDQTIAEGNTFATIALDNYVTDIDNADSEITWSYSGNTDLAVSIDANRIATITIPNADWNGSELITFTATDPNALANSDAATFTVTPINDAPVVADIPDQTVAEGASFATVNLDDYVTDVDNLKSDIVWSYSGNVELSVSIVNRVAIITAPSPDWFGVESITFTATDPGSLNASDAALFTITSVNDAPIVADIPNQTVPEGSTFVTIPLDNYVSDVDNLPSEMTWSWVGNSALTISLDVNRVATIAIPSADWNGVETITFTATDPGGLSDGDPATFTVTAVNDAPVVADIPDQTINEGQTFATIVLDDYVSDVDNADNQIAWTYAGNTELTVTIDANRIATIGIPSPNWNGAETITFTATDPGLLADSDPATFTVSAVNNAPVVSDIPNQTVSEGNTFVTIPLDSYVTDIDNLPSEMTWTYSGNVELTVSIDINRIATVTIPHADWNGSELITFTATDPGGLSDSDPATFTVTAVNDAPVMTDIPDQTIAEGGTFTTIPLDNYVSDVDNADNQISWSYAGNTELTVSIDVNRIATITIPSPNWNGSETITFTATDPGQLTASDPATFTVTAVNNAPVVTDIPDQTVSEGSNFTTITLDNYVSDVDNTDAELTWTYSGNTELTVAIDANRIATITIPDVNWNGSEQITFTATDPSALSNSDAATFTVTAINDAPVVADIPNQTVAEGTNFTTVNLDDYVTDVDNLPSEMTWTYSGNAQLSVSIVNRVAIITTPSADWNGFETITFRATDPGGLSDFDPALFTVTAVNDAPVVSDIPNQTVPEGSTFVTIPLDSFVTDVDNLPSEMNWTWVGNTALTVSLNVNRVATITIPNANWNGSETISFTATDPGGLSDSDPATFTVTAVNDTPVVADIPDQTVAEGATFVAIPLDNFVSDVDNVDSEMTWTYAGNTELTVTIDASRIATIAIPDVNWNGAETITFTATDPGGLSDSDPATFTVTAVNDAPVVTDIPDQTVLEGATFTTIALDDFVSDIDNTDAEMTWTYAGNTELTVSIDASRIATIAIPNINWNGAETITFTATDPGGLSASDPATFTVTSANDTPVLAPIGPQATDENVPLAFQISATDADGTIPAFSADPLPTGAILMDNNDGTADFAWNPTYDQAGIYNVTFVASDGIAADSEIVTITVTDVNRAPVADAGPDQNAVPVGVLVTLDGTASVDPDGDPINYSWTQVGGTVATLSDTTLAQPTFTPAVADLYLFELTVDDNTLFSVPDTVRIQVVNVAPPQAISDLTIQINADAVDLGWSAVTLDADGFPTTVDHYVVYRGTQAYFMPTPADSIGGTAAGVTSLTDADLGGVNVVGDTLTQYFYTVEAVDIFGGRSAVSNRVGEYDYQLVTTATTDYNLVAVPFANTGITDADGLIAAIGVSNVNTVNRYNVVSQSYEARFAAGFGTNFAVTVGGIYQVNAATSTVFSVAGDIPAPGAVTYNLSTTATTDYNFLMIPFEDEATYLTAQDVLNAVPGMLNTLNNYVAGSQSYVSRFAAGFGTNFPVRAGKPYQGNAAATGVFPAP